MFYKTRKHLQCMQIFYKTSFPKPRRPTRIHFVSTAYRISSYKALPRMIPATLIIPAILTILCSRNVVFSNKTRI